VDPAGRVTGAATAWRVFARFGAPCFLLGFLSAFLVGMAPQASAGPGADAAAAVVSELRTDDTYPVVEESVRLALLTYARSGDPADLELAEILARRMIPAGGPQDRVVGSSRPLYLVAQAGGSTQADGERMLVNTRELLDTSERRATTDSFAGISHDLFVRAMVTGDPGAISDALTYTDRFFRARVRARGAKVEVLAGGSAAQLASLSDYLETLRAATAATEATGSFAVREVMVRVGQALIDHFWEDDRERFRVPARDVVGMPEDLTLLLEARTALALWRAGELAEVPLLRGRGERALRGIQAECLESRLAAAPAALAAATMEGPTVRMVIVGDPGNESTIAFRRECMMLFEPRGLLIHLDPAFDAERIEALGLPLVNQGALLMECGSLRSEPVAVGGARDAVNALLARAEKSGQ